MCWGQGGPGAAVTPSHIPAGPLPSVQEPRPGCASPVPASLEGAALLGPGALFTAPRPRAWPAPRRTFHLERRDHELPSV